MRARDADVEISASPEKNSVDPTSVIGKTEQSYQAVRVRTQAR